MKKLFLLSLLLVLSVGAFGQTPAGFDLSNYGVRIQPDKRVMVVLATLEAARTTNEAGESVPVLKTPLSAEGEKFRELLNSDLAALNDDLRQRISTFVINYKKRNSGKSDAELVAPFISMAYALTPAPEFSDPVVTSDLPGSLLDVLDFAPLVRDFYRRSSFAGNMPEYVKNYQQVADAQLRSSAREMVNDLLSYLHTKPQLVFAERVKTQTQRTRSKKAAISNVETRERERRFFIVPEMLAPAGTVNFLNIKDDYFAVLPPETDLGGSGVRRAYLQFVIDPLVLNNSKEIAVIRDSVKKLIDDRRKIDPTISPDIYLTISRSLVTAIEAKQNQNTLTAIATSQARQKIDRARSVNEKTAISGELEKYIKSLEDETALQLSESYEKGSVLSFYFAEQLKGVEDSGFDIASSMREMLLSFDPAKEVNRLDQYADARKRALAVREDRKKNPTAATIAENPVTATLREVQLTINAKNYSKADADLKTLLKGNPAEPRIYYSLGRVASLSAEDITDSEQQAAKLREAKTAYENVIRISQRQKVDAALVSLSYVALAKIYEFFDDNTYAMGLYDKAIQIGEVTGGAQREALAAKQRLLKPQ
ncbi:MAG: hypothetical protein ABI791_10685 [Acidobacteriota bacterium]